MMAKQILHIVFHFPQKDMKNSTSFQLFQFPTHNKSIQVALFEQTTGELSLTYARFNSIQIAQSNFSGFLCHTALPVNQPTILYFNNVVDENLIGFLIGNKSTFVILFYCNETQNMKHKRKH